MSKYTFTFKKDDIFVEFVTTDRDIVEQQFQIWVTAASDYIKNRPYKAKKIDNPTPVVEEAVEAPAPVVQEETVAEEAIVEEKVEENFVQVEEAVKTEEPIQEQPIIEAEPQLVQEIEELIEEKAEVFDNAAGLLRTINSIQNPADEETAKFEDVLGKTIENPTFEPNRSKDERFINLVKAKNTTDSFHYLIITAYYLSEIEKYERFSLKQINAKLMQNLSEVIDHSILQEALNQGLIQLVPDLTGISDISEYNITELGESFFVNKI